MKIDSIALFRVDMPLIYPFRTAFGNTSHIESLIVRFESSGAVGWGESTPWDSPGYSPEYAEGVFLTLKRFLAPTLLGKDVSSGEQLQRMLTFVKGNNFAKAALDSAWWDLYARMSDRPLWRCLGGEKPEVSVGADFGVMDRIEDLIETMAGAIESGFERTKLKFRPGWEIEMVRAVRNRFPTHPIHVDCNSAYTLKDLPMLEQLDEYNLEMIEQPLSHDDLVDHATMQARINTAICLDESISSAANARKAAEINACRWINIKPGRLGGLTNAVATLDTCAEAGIPCWVGGMLESSLGGHQCLALATLPNIAYPNDIFPSDRFYTDDLCDPPLEVSAPSRMQAPDTPGSGATPDEDRLKLFTVQYELLRP